MKTEMDHDIDTSGKNLATPAKFGSSSAKVGFESHVDKFANHTEATRVTNNQFGRAGRGPTADNSIDRGPFAVRTKLTSKP